MAPRRSPAGDALTELVLKVFRLNGRFLDAADAITAGTGTVGIRVPGGEVARALAREAGGALVSTSANPAGEPAPETAGALAAELRARVDHVLDGGAAPGGLPSTVVAVEADRIRLVRAGAIPLEALERALRPEER